MCSVLLAHETKIGGVRHEREIKRQLTGHAASSACRRPFPRGRRTGLQQEVALGDGRCRARDDSANYGSASGRAWVVT